MTIKAIETRYSGYRFRSRTEARWAVFFDAIGIKWEYEPEGFVLPDGTTYLPDFKLFYPEPEDNFYAWVEVKGVEPSIEERAKLKHLLDVGGNAMTGLFLVGSPLENPPIKFDFVTDDFASVSDLHDHLASPNGQRKFRGWRDAGYPAIGHTIRAIISFCAPKSIFKNIIPAAKAARAHRFGERRGK